jgi:endogenous inhibitor of DNA gyrase (YacG/DUF329 family)
VAVNTHLEMFWDGSYDAPCPGCSHPVKWVTTCGPGSVPRYTIPCTVCDAREVMDTLNRALNPAA